MHNFCHNISCHCKHFFEVFAHTSSLVSIYNHDCITVQHTSKTGELYRPTFMNSKSKTFLKSNWLRQHFFQHTHILQPKKNVHQKWTNEFCREFRVQKMKRKIRNKSGEKRIVPGIPFLDIEPNSRQLNLCLLLKNVHYLNFDADYEKASSVKQRV